MQNDNMTEDVFVDLENDFKDNMKADLDKQVDVAKDFEALIDRA